MKTFPRTILALAVVSALVAGITPSAFAQANAVLNAYSKAAAGNPAGGGFATSDTYTPLLIKYVGSGTGGTVTTTINNNITLKTGPVAGSAADATTECPVSGALGGVIDVTNAACDTLGEVVDYINASANWRAVILDGTRASSAKNINTLAETAANVVDGLALTADTDTVEFGIVRAIVPAEARKIGFYLDSRGARTGAQLPLFPSPFVGTRVMFLKGIGNLTFAANATVMELVSECPVNGTLNKLPPSPPVAGIVGGSSVTTTEWQEVGAATTVDKTFDFSTLGFFGPKDCKLLLKYRNTTSAATAGRLFITAQHFQYNDR